MKFGMDQSAYKVTREFYLPHNPNLIYVLYTFSFSFKVGLNRKIFNVYNVLLQKDGETAKIKKRYAWVLGWRKWEDI